MLGDAQQSVRYTRNSPPGVDTRPAYRPFGQTITPATGGSAGERGYLDKPADPNGASPRRQSRRGLRSTNSTCH